jgi:hypothetical protein
MRSGFKLLLTCPDSINGLRGDDEPMLERILIEGYREVSGESQRIPPERIAFR